MAPDPKAMPSAALTQLARNHRTMLFIPAKRRTSQPTKVAHAGFIRTLLNSTSLRDVMIWQQDLGTSRIARTVGDGHEEHPSRGTPGWPVLQRAARSRRPTAQQQGSRAKETMAEPQACHKPHATSRGGCTNSEEETVRLFPLRNLPHLMGAACATSYPSPPSRSLQRATLRHA